MNDRNVRTGHLVDADIAYSQRSVGHGEEEEVAPVESWFHRSTVKKYDLGKRVSKCDETSWPSKPARPASLLGLFSRRT